MSVVGSGKMKAGVAFVGLLGLLGGAVNVPVAGAQTGTIAGVVFDDANRNGVQDAGEAPFPGRQLWIDKATGVNAGYAVTDADGRYWLSGLDDGDYRVWFASSDWDALRNDWVPTTTGSLRFERRFPLSGTATADFGLRRIVRSTVAGSPISAVTGADGMRVESYNDAVTATELYDQLHTGSLLGAERPVTKVRFDLGDINVTHSSWTGSEGAYTSYAATIDSDFVTWLVVGSKSLFHEYGHAWSLYNAIMVQQTESLDGYLSARGLLGDPRVGSNVYWDPKEMVAEDYRQLFGSGSALTYPQANVEIPRAADVPGLSDWLRTTFTSSPAPVGPAPPPSPEPSPVPLDVSGLAMSPDPVSTSGNLNFTLSAQGIVTVSVVDAAGSVVRTLLGQVSQAAGPVSVAWDRKNDAGRKVKAGTYSAAVTASDGTGAVATASVGFSVVDLPKGRSR